MTNPPSAEPTAPRGTLCVLSKAPAPGQVKTRLAGALGAEAAAELSRAFLSDTWSLASRVQEARAVLFLSGRAELLPALEPAPEILDQGDGDLGARMEHALSSALSQGAAWAIVIGTDLPGLPESRLARAASMLENGASAVLGPADDGGFYLLGLKRCPPGLLSGLAWSTGSTCRQTFERLRDRGLDPELLDSWYDVDEPEDLERLRRDLRTGSAHAPHTEAALARVAPRLGVVIPVLDEEACIGRRLDELARMPGVDEVVVVDGGSRDRTPEIVRARSGVRLLSAARGRALQMNAGARAAQSPVLLFLHADAELPSDAVDWIERTLSDPDTVAGAFRTWHVVDAGSQRRAPWLHLADLRSRLTRTPYGDQALFVRREAFERVGGFPDIPLMEDLELSLRLRRAGRVRIVPASVRVSGRRFLAHPIRDSLLVNLFPLLYRAGVPPALLARAYRDTR